METDIKLEEIIKSDLFVKDMVKFHDALTNPFWNSYEVQQLINTNVMPEQLVERYNLGNNETLYNLYDSGKVLGYWTN